MIVKNFFNILLAYGILLPQILFFEIFYLLRGYKRNSFNILNNDRYTDNIPCPYFFLHKLKKFFQNTKIENFMDLGCGDGRSIYFFNKQKKINFYGIEYNNLIYNSCKESFKKYDNVQIINDDIMSFNFLKFDCDCYFIGDPLKQKIDFENLIKRIIEEDINVKKRIYFILANVDSNKRDIFYNYKLIDSFQKNNKGYYIYSNEKINEDSKN